MLGGIIVIEYIWQDAGHDGSTLTARADLAIREVGRRGAHFMASRTAP